MLWFDRAGPFYPLAINYALNIFSLKETAINEANQRVRTLAGLPREHIGVLALRETTGRPEFAEIIDPIRKLAGPLDLQTSVGEPAINITLDDIGNEIFENGEYLIQFQLKAGEALLLAAYEVSKAEHDKSPVWEFFRHCRNAAGHGGKLSFKNDEPRRPAEWRGKTIRKEHEGRPLFGLMKGESLLSPGDPLLLLSDIEFEIHQKRPDSSHPRLTGDSNAAGQRAPSPARRP